mmetsp:Transcript_80987/g.217282  ORF Transcript_80987/g.217282 Transcript_80987/m.217282 type:complete len:347 (-) Transcript_80987:2085-3125(-)
MLDFSKVSQIWSKAFPSSFPSSRLTDICGQAPAYSWYQRKDTVGQLGGHVLGAQGSAVSKVVVKCKVNQPNRRKQISRIYLNAPRYNSLGLRSCAQHRFQRLHGTRVLTRQLLCHLQEEVPPLLRSRQPVLHLRRVAQLVGPRLQRLVPLGRLVQTVDVVLEPLLVPVHGVHMPVNLLLLPLQLLDARPGLLHGLPQPPALLVQLPHLLLVPANLRLHVAHPPCQVRHSTVRLRLARPLGLLHLTPQPDHVALENRPLHLHHELLLSPHQLRIAEVHPVNLFAHPRHHVLPLVLGRVGRLQLLLQLDLALRRHHLPLHFHDVRRYPVLVLHCAANLKQTLRLRAKK